MNIRCADHNACMGEDRNNDISYGQLNQSVEILQSFVVALEEEQDLEQLKVNCLKGIHHSEILWAWSSPKYERTTPCHIQDQFCACYGQALPKV